MIREKTLRVCMYTPSAVGGHALYTQELLTALSEAGGPAGARPELVTCSDLAPEHRTDAYPIHRVLPPLAHRSSFRTKLGWISSRLSYYARRERMFLEWAEGQPDLDLIHFQEYTPWFAPGHFRRLRRRGIALVYTVHNIFLHHYLNAVHKYVRDGSFRRAWRSCDALIVHTEGLRDALSDVLGPGHPPIHVTPHGVWTRREDEPESPPAPPAAEEAGGRLLFFGVIRANKGLHVLLRAMERLPGQTLTVAGAAEEAEYFTRVRGLLEKLPPGRVEMIERFIEEREVPEIFGRCGVVVLPYTSFTAQSGVLHQALAFDRPVVATDVGAMGECVRRWGIGRVVPPDDEAALAEAVEAVLEPANYRRAREAIGRVRAELTWSRMAEATLAVYRSASS